MSRMFKTVDKTWNVFVGCRFDCSYCNARKAALTRFKHLDRYKDGFNPHLVESELNKTFRTGDFVMVSYMGDISFAAIPDIVAIRSRITKCSLTDFLLCSKNPRCFSSWGIPMPENVHLGTTLETNRSYGLTKAPLPIDRFRSLISHPHPHKFVSIEPIMDFDLPVMVAWFEALQPEIVEVGADNYHNHLPEPSPEKLEHLIRYLRDICPRVIEKDGLQRLKGGRR